MASINARLVINEVGNGVMDSVTTNVETNNISVLPYTTDITSWFVNQTASNRDYQGAIVDVINTGNPIKYGTAKYGAKQVSNNQYTSQYQGLMFRTPNDLVSNFTITIVGTDILSFNIWFDNAMGQRPTSYTVYSSISGTTTSHTTNDNIVRVSGLLSGYGTTIITITGWANNNVPIAIKFVENVEINVDMNKHWIDSFETQSQATANPSGVEYGILANTGNIKLIDKDGKLYNYSKLGYFNANLFSLYLFINGRQVQHHISTSAPYYANNNTLALELTDNISNWNRIIVPEQSFNDTDLYSVLENLLIVYAGYSNQDVYDSCMNYYLYSGVSDHTDYIMNHLLNVIVSFTLQQGSLLDQLNKICQAAQLNAYFKDNGKLVFKMARPKMVTTERNNKIIVIPYEKQYGTFDYSILVDNRYDVVSFDNDTQTTYGNKNVLKLQSNEIIENSYIEYSGEADVTSKEAISKAILLDYAQGVRTANLKVFPSDLYYTNGNTAKNWRLGEIIEINDILLIQDKDGNDVLKDKNNLDVYFRVVDRKVIYEGQVLIELTLQEIIN